MIDANSAAFMLLLAGFSLGLIGLSGSAEIVRASKTSIEELRVLFSVFLACSVLALSCLMPIALEGLAGPAANFTIGFSSIMASVLTFVGASEALVCVLSKKVSVKFPMMFWSMLALAYVTSGFLLSNTILWQSLVVFKICLLSGSLICVARFSLFVFNLFRQSRDEIH